ncbi:ester cyclase [Actinoplanes oblitus]|uniref:Ester cyclase n=1 Tax=Actinoplanes oblitus TaxID=3040509 RepID=A0ABY8W724_9ACTN|nr:ester cyclase [Actinoplanes oblitus]WIM92817.1 ester cyclase [Actinoplanes oblitus]
MTSAEHPNVALYQRFLTAFNSTDYDAITKLVDPGFVDHHPGFQVDDIDSYLAAMREAKATLELTGELIEAVAVDDRVITRCRLTGRHVGAVLGEAPTGRSVSWTTTEIWRISGDRFVERWAQDDLLGLKNQLSADEENVALIRKLNDVVNERRYDDMDELFATSFIDNNPAWSVRDLDELKTIIRDAHEALDFTSHHDLIYPAEGGKVVIHITFTGRHVKPFFDREPTGKQVQWTSVEVYRIEHNKIVERWVQADTTGLMRQLGVPLP